MPHPVPPLLSPAMPTMISKSADYSGIPPATEDVEPILHTLFNAEKAQDSLDAAYGLTETLIKSVGARGLVSYNLIPEIRKAASEKKNGAKRESAMFILGALFERFPRQQPLSEVVFSAPRRRTSVPSPGWTCRQGLLGSGVCSIRGGRTV